MHIMPALYNPDKEDIPTRQELQKGAKNPFAFVSMGDNVLYPKIVVPLIFPEEEAKRIIKSVRETNAPLNRRAFLVHLTRAQEDSDMPLVGGYHQMGTLCELLTADKIPGDNMVLWVYGWCKLLVQEVNESIHRCSGIPKFERPLPSPDKSPKAAQELEELTGIVRDSVTLILRHQSTDGTLPDPLLHDLKLTADPEVVINFAAAIAPFRGALGLELLGESNIAKRGIAVLTAINGLIDRIALRKSIQQRTRSQMDDQQREFFLREEIRSIQEELGDNPDATSPVTKLAAEGARKQWPPRVKEIFSDELEKLPRLHPQSPEYAIQLQYLRTMLDLPWDTYSEDVLDLARAEEILNRDHFGLEKVKERILEHLAVIKLKNNLKAPILCLWGPPGVGKTSLGKSIADSLGRKYVRISLGGMHDEAEIRGHRRTYVSAMCGRVLQEIRKAGTSNPVFVLDEIDKIGEDFRGDPASALLEVLDPEQNKNFHDNYLDIDYDLSKVLFIATANTLSTISRPLLDRMELIQVSGYVRQEKVEIAKRHLFPKEMEEHGFKKDDFEITTPAVEFIIDRYTRESGVRQLGKQFSAIIRKNARKYATDQTLVKTVGVKEVKEFLREPIYPVDMWQDFGIPGVVTGLAWTEVGGEILFVESNLIDSEKGEDLILTGNLGDVMKESAVIAFDYIRAHFAEIGIAPEVLLKKRVHVHVPEGAIPKDGPSAGITMVTSLVSTLTGRRVKPRIAMTGEVTLTGRVLPVGGVKEKILAAKRAGVTDIIMSKENRKDINEIQPLYIKGITFHYINHARELFPLALEPDGITPSVPTA